MPLPLFWVRALVETASNSRHTAIDLHTARLTVRRACSGNHCGHGQYATGVVDSQATDLLIALCEPPCVVCWKPIKLAQCLRCNWVVLQVQRGQGRTFTEHASRHRLQSASRTLRAGRKHGAPVIQEDELQLQGGTRDLGRHSVSAHLFRAALMTAKLLSLLSESGNAVSWLLSAVSLSKALQSPAEARRQRRSLVRPNTSQLVLHAASL